jgi:hypothetical protein
MDGPVRADGPDGDAGSGIRISTIIPRANGRWLRT